MTHTLPAVRSSTWVTITALPTRVTALAPGSEQSDPLRERLDVLVGSLQPGEYLLAQLAASSSAMSLGLGLASATSQHTAGRIANTLEGLATTTPGESVTPRPLAMRLRTTPSTAPSGSAHPWPSTGIDVDTLLSATRHLTGTITFDVAVSASTAAVQPVTLQRRLARVETRVGAVDEFTAIRRGIAAGERQFDITIELTATHLSDIEVICQAMFPGMSVIAEPARAAIDFSPIDRLLRGETTVAGQVAGLLPIASLPTDSLAPIERRATLVGSTRAPIPGQLELGIGRGSTPIGISPSDLYQHLVVYGKTGFGKTTAMQQLLRQLQATTGTPFLIIDPIKDDYRPLLGEVTGGIGESYWEVGAEDSPPINLLAPPEGVNALDYAGLFAGAFAQASRLDEFPLAVATLRDCLDRTITRWQVEGHAGHPPLSSLYNEVQRYARSSDARSRGAVETAVSIKARLRALVTGSAGAALLGGPEAGVDWARLTDGPMLISLRRFVDPESRNAVFALLLAGFIAYRNRHPAPRGHLMVVEEAHTLFPKPHEDSGGLLGQHLSSAIASLRGQQQGFALVTQNPEQLPARVRSLVGTRLSFRVDEHSAAELAPNRPDIATTLTSLGRGDIAMWAASGDPQVTYLRTLPPPSSATTPAPGRLMAERRTLSPFTDTVLATAHDDDVAAKIGRYIAGYLSWAPGDPIDNLVTRAETLTEEAMAQRPPVTSPKSDVAKAILTVALVTSVGNDVALVTYMTERAASSRIVAKYAAERD